MPFDKRIKRRRQIENRYILICGIGEKLEPIPIKVKGKRGRYKRTKGRNLVERLIREQDAVLVFAFNKEGINKGKGLQKLKKPLLFLYDKILFSKIREGFGGKIDFYIGGGTLLDIELQRFFYAIGMPMFQGYGLTEAAPIISSNALKRHKLGS